jgi:AcrR family transcriptional regulator
MLSNGVKSKSVERINSMDEIVNIPKTKRGQATLEKICSASETLFYEKGYHNTSIIDITNLSGIALGTFYIYFKDKYSTYKYLLIRYSHQIRKEISTATNNIENRKEKERLGLKIFLEYIKTNKHAYNIIWESLYIDKTLFINYYDTFADRYSKGIIEGQKNGEVYEIDPMIISYFLMGVSSFIGLKYIMFNDENTDLDYVVDEVMKILQKGLFK